MKKTNGDGITWLILAGRKAPTCKPHLWVENTRQYMVFDLLEKIEDSEFIEKIIVSSNDEDFLRQIQAQHPGVTLDSFSDENFHFGDWLQERIKKYAPRRLFYWGAGASPYITRQIIDEISRAIIAGNDMLYANNFFSSDWVAFTPASAALEIPPPPLDNNLAYSLWKDKGITSIYLESSVEISADVDTPADLLVMSQIPHTGKRTAQYIKSLNLDSGRVASFISLLKERNRIFLAGRVGSALFRYLDLHSGCSFRVISEERGMRASGRAARGEVRSILGIMMENMGIDKTFSFVENVSAGAVIDSRVAFNHLRGSVNTPDRFHSDLGFYDEIEDPVVREFTRRVVESPIPILTGGHSLILGGLWAMVETFGKIR